MPNALLLIPLKLRDGAHALSGFPPPLASILFALEPKKTRPPHLGAGHERQKKTLQDLGNARRKAGKLERKRSPTTPIYSCVGRQASKPVEGRKFGQPVTVRHSTSKRSPRLSRRDMTEQNKAESLDAKWHSIGPDQPTSNGASQGDQGKPGRGPERGAAR